MTQSAHDAASPQSMPHPGINPEIDLRLSHHPFLKDLSPRHRQALAAAAMPKSFAPNERIFREGDPANRFYLIESGSVAVEAQRPDHSPVLVETIGAGDVLGWSWLFPPFYWHFDARAIETTQAIFFYGTRLREMAEEDHDLGFELLRRMAAVVIRRLQASRKQLLYAQPK